MPDVTSTRSGGRGSSAAPGTGTSTRPGAGPSPALGAADGGERSGLRAYAGSHPGLQRENNEDRCHADAERGIFFVIDGVGGQAAGDKAAELAYTNLIARLERETGSAADRVREAITLANNEIYDASHTDPRWLGMACVLTVAIVHDGHATIGHVGDSRLYRLTRGGAIRKITRDHSPVGEREDRGELSEGEAMRHPRRNEIYRDVGSEPHSPTDPSFIDVVELDLAPEDALLLCTDGLSDLVSSARISQIAARYAGDPEAVVEALLQAANDAGGKDNVSAVFVEREAFRGRSPAGRLRPAGSLAVSGWLALAIGSLLGIALVLAALAWTRTGPLLVRDLLPAASWPRTWVVNQDGSGDFTSIRAALERARAGDVVRVEPGDYAEHLVLTGSVTVVSATPGGATIVPPAGGTGPAIAVEIQAGDSRLRGFRIVGDDQHPMSVGIRLRRAGGEVDGVEISGARAAGIEMDGQTTAVIRSSYIHDNPGIGVAIGASAQPKLLHNVIADNGRQPEASKPGVEMHETSRPTLFGNIVANNGIDAIRGLTAEQRETIARDNIVGRPAAAQAPPAGRATPPARRK